MDCRVAALLAMTTLGIRYQVSGIRNQKFMGASRRGRRENPAPQHLRGGEAAGNFF
jgi:hypothetical protein